MFTETNQIVKHDVLSFERSRVHVIAAIVNLQSKSITCGHFYINDLVEKTIILDSGTGSQYKVDIPDEYLNIRDSGQFNITLFFSERFTDK